MGHLEATTATARPKATWQPFRSRVLLDSSHLTASPVGDSLVCRARSPAHLFAARLGGDSERAGSVPFAPTARPTT